RPEVAILVGPFVPDGDAVVLQISDVGVAFEEPEQLMHDRLQRQPLGGQHRKTRRQVEAHLVAEDRQRPGAGAVVLLRAIGEDAFKQVVVLVHGVPFEKAYLARHRRGGSTDSALACDYTRKNVFAGFKRQGRILRPALDFSEVLVGPLSPRIPRTPRRASCARSAAPPAPAGRRRPRSARPTADG